MRSRRIGVGGEVERRRAAAGEATEGRGLVEVAGRHGGEPYRASGGAFGGPGGGGA
jgi:hypothetical protein